MNNSNNVEVVITPIPNLSIETWVEKKEREQVDAREAITQYVRHTHELTIRALPRWWTRIIDRLGANKLTMALTGFLVLMLRISMTETSEKPNKRTTVVKRGRREIGRAVLALAEESHEESEVEAMPLVKTETKSQRVRRRNERKRELRKTENPHKRSS